MTVKREKKHYKNSSKLTSKLAQKNPTNVDSKRPQTEG